MDLNGAKGILKSLADGVDPLTGEVLPEDHICNQPEIIRAIYMVLMELSRGKQHREKPENDGAPWSEEEEQLLCDMFDQNRTTKEICDYFKRTNGAIAARLVRVGKISDRAEFRNNNKPSF